MTAKFKKRLFWLTLASIILLVVLLPLTLPTVGFAPALKPATTHIRTVAGTVQENEISKKRITDNWTFELEPIDHGWEIKIVSKDGRELTRLTPPFHFAVNPRIVEGWHFRNKDNTGPNQAGPKNVNAPGRLRDEIFFHPDVGKEISYPPKDNELQRVKQFGHVSFRILSYDLKNLDPGERAQFDSLRFRAKITWPTLLHKYFSGLRSLLP